jgi:GTP-binding protein
MKFVDELIITLVAGKGGDGICSFRREKFMPLGGPDGGDGGAGGNIYLVAKKNILNLVFLKNKTHYVATDGSIGSNNNCTGSNGKNLFIYVPLGTKLFDAKTRELIFDIKSYDMEYLLARGGSKGYGNCHFKSSINRSPKKITKGKKGEKRIVKMELNIDSNMSLLGLPNSGKSEFISNISNIEIKTSNYPFSTKNIYLGLYKSRTILDTPSLIKRSFLKKGLGCKFFKHVLRTNTIMYMLDVSYSSMEEIINNVNVIEYEMLIFNKKFFFKNKWIVFNKIDKVRKDHFESFLKFLLPSISRRRYTKIFFTSSKKSLGLSHLNRHLDTD